MQRWPSLLFPNTLRERTYTESAIRWHFLQNHSAARLSEHSDAEWAIMSVCRMFSTWPSIRRPLPPVGWDQSLSDVDGCWPSHDHPSPTHPKHGPTTLGYCGRMSLWGPWWLKCFNKVLFVFSFLPYPRTKGSGGSLRLNTWSNYRRVHLNSSAFN